MIVKVNTYDRDCPPPPDRRARARRPPPGRGAPPAQPGLPRPLPRERPLYLAHPLTHPDLGQVVATPGALAAFERAQQAPAEFIARHVSGDWGEVPEEDKTEYEVSLLNGYRILSSYRTKLGERIWILSEADRSVTTILLPEEY